jgi:predicted PurR-regulated permease PerM
VTTAPNDTATAGTYVRQDDPEATRVQRRTSLIVALLLLAIGLFTLKGFLPALIWAAIFAVGLQPLFARAAMRFPRHRRAGLPALFVLAVLLVFVIPIVMIAVPLVSDAHAAAAWLAQAKVSGVPAPAFLGSLPYGDRLVPLWQRQLGQPGEVSQLAGHALQAGVLKTGRVIGLKVVHRLVLLGFMLLALFLLLRDGEDLVTELRIGSRRAFGPAGEHVGGQIIRSIRGTVDGLVLVGLGEGVILGIAYWLAGVPRPALFGLVTALLAMIPFGAPLAFLIAAAILLASGSVTAAIVIVVLGFVTTFVADHFIRPMLIGGATRLPFIWVLLGILGGVETWGLVGLFMGPAIMAALVLLWREWIGAQRGPFNPPARSSATDQHTAGA